MTDLDAEYSKKVPKSILKLLEQQDGAENLRTQLGKRFKPADVSSETEQRRAWELCGLYYWNRGRMWEAISIFNGLYEQMHVFQKRTGKRCHKGVPLFWIYDCHVRLGNPVLAKRYLMLTLCEDAVSDKGTISPQKTGTYHRIVWGGMPHAKFVDYASEFWRLFQRNKHEGRFPEWLLQQVDQDWMTEKASAQETVIYAANHHFAEFLMSSLGKSKGTSLERLAHYLIGAMPGCRAVLRRRSRSTDYDVVGVIESEFSDFRSEVGRYFLCECKDWKKPADFTTCAKFCRVLDSTKTRFGILFSKRGVSGQGRAVDAERELLKMFQDRGIVIVVVNEDDLRNVAKGKSFITLLRTKYEQVRFDLSDAGVKESLGIA